MPIALVTGGNRGIGFEFCRQLTERGYEVIGTSRGPALELARLGVRVEPLDVTDPRSIVALCERLRPDVKLDLLVNNAGRLIRDNLDEIDPAALKAQFDVNALAPICVTAALRPLLARGAKVAVVTSRMGSIADNTSGGYYGYRMSKAALNAGAFSLAFDLKAEGIAVAILHPGYVQTDMTEGRGFITAAESARGLLDRIEEMTIETTGTFWHMNGEVLPW
jgi:NAD(P)-dependent dehydrogenase (short-subunit alcohol dehydrogenase family)